MRICCAFLALFLVVTVPYILFGQSGNSRSTKAVEAKVANRAKVGPQAAEPRRSDNSVTPASHTVPRTLQELRKTHPDQIEGDLKSIAESLSAAGLIDESNQVRMILHRIHNVHHEKLLDAYQQAASAAWEPRVSLTVKWFEVAEDSTAVDSIQKLFPVTQHQGEAADGPFPGTASASLSAEETAELIARLNQTEAKLISEQDGVLVSGREAVFIQGSAVDIVASGAVGKLVQIATTENSSANGFEVAEALRRPMTVLDGSSIRASAEVHDGKLVKLSVAAQHSKVSPISFKGEVPKSQSQRIQTVVEMNAGQSFAMFGLSSSRSVTDVNRVPILGDIPGIGPRIFASKKTRTEQPYTLCVITPKIANESDGSSKDTESGGPALLSSPRTKSK